MTFFEVPVGIGYHWEHQEESRSYSGTIQIGLDNDGQLAVINILPIEKYLSGVVPSEMPSGFPLEALKAQAVSARSKTLANLGLVHRNDPFDVCADVHCQVYSGLTNRSASAERAVMETAGLVLWKDHKICDAIYGSVCGGHGEDSDKAWGAQPKSYLQGRYDGPHPLKRYGSLSSEERARLWIDNNPPAYCNTTQGWTLDAMEYTKKYFRWEIILKQDEVKNSLQSFAGKDLGTVLDLMPLERGVSGRITKMRIVCEKDTLIVQGELNIRKALSSSTLWSSCFYALKRTNADGIPAEFVLKGAGWGHGVGMCQTGAATLALKGEPFDQILKYYFSGIRIRRIY
jgi:SpoIID/LytB domain protein